MRLEKLLGWVVATALLVPVIGQAGNRTWDGGDLNNANWSSEANWDNDTSLSVGDNLTFDGTIRQSNNNDLALTFGSLTLSTDGWDLEGKPLVLSGNINANGNAILGMTVTNTAAADQNWIVASNKTLTVNNNVTFGAGRTLFCKGPGTVVFNGATSTGGMFRANSGGTSTFGSGNFTAITYVIAGGNGTPGTINWNSAGLLHPGVRLYVGHAFGPGTFNQSAGSVYGGTSGLEFNCTNSVYNLNGGTLEVNNINWYEHGVVPPGCVLNFGGGTLKLTNSPAYAVDAGLSCVIGTNKTATINTAGFNITLNGVISGALDLGLTKTSTSGTLTLGGANTYSGFTTISGGAVKVTNANALSANTVKIALSGTGYYYWEAGILDLYGTAISNALEIQRLAAGLGRYPTGCLVNSDLSHTGILNGPMALGGNNYFGGAGNITINGQITGGISGTGNDYALLNYGTGSLTLANTNNTFDGWYYVYGGGTTVVTRLANLNEASSLGQATSGLRNRIYFSSLGGRLKYSGTTASSCDRTNVMAVAGIIDASGADSSATLTMTGEATGAGALTLAGTNTGANTYAGVIGAGSLAKSESGTWILSAANTYSGATTVNGGTLIVNGSIPSTTNVTVNAGGVLSGTGSLGGVMNVVSNGVVAAGGPDGVGTLTIASNLTFSADSINRVSVVGEGQYSSIHVVNGDVALNDAVLDLNVVGGVDPGPIGVVLIAKDSPGAVSGAFKDFPEGRVIKLGPRWYRLSYASGSSGHDVAFVPEAGTIICVQ